MNTTFFDRFKTAHFVGMLSLGLALLNVPNPAQSAQSASGAMDAVTLELGEGGDLYWGTAKGLQVSKDEGKAWSQITLPAEAQDSPISGVAQAAEDPNTLYLAGPGFGVLQSKDGGKRWKNISQALPSKKVTALTAHADQPETVYAYIEGKGIFRSQDAGASWRVVDQGPRSVIKKVIHTDMPGSMETGWLFAATKDGVRRSMDCFCGWHKAGDIDSEVYAVTYDPDEPQRVYAAAEKGIFVSTDGGETWNAIETPGTRATALVAGPSGLLYAAGKDALYRSRDQGAAWEKVRGK
jgi:photosystem II stability/assembly factor-like uncharacterized protein